MLLDGTEGQQMIDNITVTNAGKVLIQEDVGNNGAPRPRSGSTIRPPTR